MARRCGGAKLREGDVNRAAADAGLRAVGTNYRGVSKTDSLVGLEQRLDGYNDELVSIPLRRTTCYLPQR